VTICGWSKAAHLIPQEAKPSATAAAIFMIVSEVPLFVIANRQIAHMSDNRTLIQIKHQ
jgi:hypothetical protein